MVTKKELHEKYGDEKVFAVTKESFNFIKNGLSKEHLSKLVEILKKEGYFVYRRNAEYNPKFLQLIPYVLIKHKDTYFVTERLAGDERLVGMLSLGMGGHINPIDVEDGLNNIFTENINRELSKEELNIDMTKTISCKLEGVILHIDEEDIVSQDHLGLFYILETNDDSVSVKETESLVGKFMSKKEIINRKDKTESWSKIIIEEYLES